MLRNREYKPYFSASISFDETDVNLANYKIKKIAVDYCEKSGRVFEIFNMMN